MDKLAPEFRSEIMSRVRSRNTSPERRVRSLLHSLGFRFRLHKKDLPGKPDIVLPKYRTCIFVHGCFWHQHPGCKRATVPSTRREFWAEKFQKNRARDNIVESQLISAGWRVVVVWECQTKDVEMLKKLLVDVLFSSED